MTRVNLTKSGLIAFLILLLALPVVYAEEEATGTETEAELQAQSERDLLQDIREYIFLYGTIYRELNENYVDQIDPKEFMQAGIDGMLETLDPYTEYFEPEETDDIDLITQGKYGGIGIQIGLRGPDRELTIIAPIEGTPGWRLGLRPGDRIIKIEDESTAGFNTKDAADRMRGTPGDTVSITIKRPGIDEPIEYNIKREIIPVIDISYSGFIEPGVGYIRFTRFSRNGGNQLRAAIDSLMNLDMEALIFDLRGNPGGLLHEAVDVSENFLPKGSLVVSTKGRFPQSNREFYTRTKPSLPEGIPLVVLVNEGSASASEIVSGAVQDHDRGVIVGRTSFGKGLVQSILDFDRYGTKLKLTTAKYYTPSGRLIQKIDYFSDNKALIQTGDTDELESSKFFTGNGRPVNAHGGIQPDFDVEMPEVGYAVIELWRQGKFFEFVDKYVSEHPEQQSFEITDDMWVSFKDFLQETEFTFKTETERQLERIREDAEVFHYGDAFLKELEDLEEMSQQTRASMLDADEREIRIRLESELASRIFGSKERVEAALQYDPQIQKALEIIHNQQLYGDVLSGKFVPEKPAKEEDEHADAQVEMDEEEY